MEKKAFCCFILFTLILAVAKIDATKAQWTRVYGTMSQVHANSFALWGIDAKLNAYYCFRPCTGNWIHVGNNMVNIDVDAFYSWGIGNDGFAYRKGMQNSGGWVKHITFSNTIDIAAEVTWMRHYTGTLHKVPGKFDQIDANSQYVYALNRTTSTISSRPIAPIHGRGEWRIIPGKMKYVTAGIHDIFAIGVDDKLYRCTIPCAGIWELMGSPSTGVVQLDATNEALFAVNSGGEIYRHEIPL